MNDNPNTTAEMWTKHPIKIPSEEIKPAFIPCDMLREATYNISFPGVRFNKREAMKNK